MKWILKQFLNSLFFGNRIIYFILDCGNWKSIYTYKQVWWWLEIYSRSNRGGMIDQRSTLTQFGTHRSNLHPSGLPCFRSVACACLPDLIWNCRSTAKRRDDEKISAPRTPPVRPGGTLQKMTSRPRPGNDRAPPFLLRWYPMNSNDRFWYMIFQ